MNAIQDLIANNARCTVCGSPMVAMASGKGLRCGKPGNRYLAGEKRWSLCNHTVFHQITPNKSEQKFIARPSNFPEINTPTEQQLVFREKLATCNVRIRISNAGPGCAKTSTSSWSLKSVLARLGTLRDFNMLAFNVNAKEVFLSKLPYVVSDIYTMNGFGMKKQGYRADQIDTKKIRAIFNVLVKEEKKKAVNPDEVKSSFYKVEDLIERMRAWALYAPAGETVWWKKAIDATVERFDLLGNLSPKEVQEAKDNFYKYVPVICERALEADHMIDLTEQWFRPVAEAIQKSGIFLPSEMLRRDFEFSDLLIKGFARLVRQIEAPAVNGLVLDEAQDLCLGQMLYFLACSYRSGEVVLIGDDKSGKFGEPGYKSGQGIYGWRGSFAGSMKLFARIWTELTGEVADEVPLSVTHRCSAAVVRALRPLNSVLTTSRPDDSGHAFESSWSTAFSLWCGMPDNTSAFWITRTNKEAAKVFVRTIKERVKCGFRGGNYFPQQITRILESASEVNMNEKTGEFPATLKTVSKNLEDYLADFPEREREEMMEQFVLSVVDEVLADPTVLAGAELPANPTIGNVRRFFLYFADNNSSRTITNVYRVKGDEAKWVFVSDCDKFNTPWGGDVDEAAACRNVACSRAIDVLVVAGHLDGIDAMPIPEDHGLPQKEMR